MAQVNAPIPVGEKGRLREIERLDIEGLQGNASLALLVKLACSCLEAPMAMVSMVEANRQLPLVGHGCDLEAIPRELSFCAHAIAAEAPVFVVPDARLDGRFRDNPLVTAGPGVRFYAAAVLEGVGGHRLGTLCVVDDRFPHHPSDRQVQQLRWLGDLAALELERHHRSLLCPVTGLPTLNQLRRVGRREWQSVVGRRESLALLLVDLNNFRAVNRCCGHEEGDRLLRMVANVIADHCRPQDFPAHVQADRFALLLPLQDEDQGLVLARELQRRLSALELAEAPPGYQLLPVVGLALQRADDADFDVLMDRSEQALDLARLQGDGAMVELRDGPAPHHWSVTAGRW